MNEIVMYSGVKVVGYGNVPGRVAKDASALYAKNIFNFLSLLIDKENKKINFDFEDEIISSVLLTHDGDVRLEQFK
jgi:NAD(P) transhydrogenase subunit alpha